MTTSTPPDRDRPMATQTPDFADLPGLPHTVEGPVFAAPWQAQAFAMTVKLHERGCFTWSEWSAYLSAEIRRAQADSDPDTGATYYRHWLAALEKILAAKGVVAAPALAARRDAWETAARQTPHGQPVVLPPEQTE